MRFQKSAEILEPFVLEASKYYDLTLVTKIQGFKVPLNKSARTDGLCQPLRNGRFIIKLRLWGKNSKKTRHVVLTWEEILHCLAHELAHAIDWDADHNYEHHRIMSHLLLIFSDVAQYLKMDDLTHSPSL